MLEEWRVIAEAPAYAVSNLGRVRRVAPDKFNRPMRVLRTPLNDKGYPNLNLHIDGKQYLRRVHQLVCTAFHGPKPTDKHECRHLDGDPLNNRADNLTWGTSAENEQDKRRHGTYYKRFGKVNFRLTLSETAIHEIKTAKASRRSIARQFGISCHTVNEVIEGRRVANG